MLGPVQAATSVRQVSLQFPVARSSWGEVLLRNAGLLFLAAAAALIGCHRLDSSNAEERFRRIRLDFLQATNLDRAKKDADLAFKEYADRDATWAWRFRLLEADILLNQGSSGDVLVLLKGEPPSFSAEAGDLRVRKRMLEAVAYSHKGEMAAADAAFEDAERMCRPSACEAAGELARIGGSLKFDENDQVGAHRFYRESLIFARSHGDGFLEVSDLLNLGLVATQEAHFDEAVDWLGNAQRMSHRIHSSLDEEKAIGNLGWAYYRLGNFDRSLGLSNQAIDLARQLKVGIDELEWLNNVELVYLAERKFDNATDHYHTTLKLAEASQNLRQEIDALSALAYISLQTGHLDRAATYIDRASALGNRSGNRSEGVYPRLLRGQLLLKRGELTAAEKMFAELAGDRDNDVSLRWESEQSLAGAYAEEGQIDKADQEYRKALATVSTARCDISREELRMPFLTNATSLFDGYIDFLVQQGREIEALKTADESRALTLAEGLGVGGRKCLAAEASFDPRRMARQAQATILFYWLGEKRSYLWAVDQERTELFPLPAASTLGPVIQAYGRSLLGARDVLQSEDENGELLYRTLIAPAAEFVPAGSRVIVITNGSLSGLSFDTLIVPGPLPHYWIEDVTVENASSLRLLAAGAGKRERPRLKLLLMGDPLPTSEFPALPNAVQETRNIGEFFPEALKQVYAGGSATATAYLASRPERFEYLHFVAHGTASEASPLDSAVILSPLPDGGSKLYARDIITQPLNAKLVTISACRGAGTSWIGEGLVGLSWAFLHAGAHNVVGALWDVDDTSTPRLMHSMYSELAQGARPDAALRTAKLSLLHSNIAAFRKPYYWAPFQLYAGP